MSQKKRGWIKAAVRIAVSAGLIGVICYMLQFDDRVVLADGHELRGRIVAQDAAGVRFRETGGAEEQLPLQQIRQDQHGNPAVRPGVLTIFRQIDRRLALIGLAMLLSCYWLVALRWLILLRSQAVEVTYWQAVRWTFIGMFWNNLLPGSTGGDLAKAFYVARECHARARAVVSVFVDRAIGLVALLLLAGAVCLFRFDRPEFREVSLAIFAVLAGLFVGTTVYFSRRIRRWIRFDAILARLPLQGVVQAVDEAVLMYRTRIGAVALAVALGLVSQIVLVGSQYVFGLALGIDRSAGTYYIFVPLTMIATALPIAAQGWGVGEAAYAYLFSLVGVAKERAVGLSVAYRLCTVLISLIGGPFVLAGGRVSQDEIDRTLARPALARD